MRTALYSDCGIRVEATLYLLSSNLPFFSPLDEAYEKYCRLSRASILEPNGLAV